MNLKTFLSKVSRLASIKSLLNINMIDIDWDDNDTKLDGPETLWEEKWDDDDADDEFSIQLR